MTTSTAAPEPDAGAPGSRQRRRTSGLWRMVWNLYARCYDVVTGLGPYQEMLEQVTAALALSPGLRVLDAGCGTGILAEHFAAAGMAIDYVGVDFSPVMLAHARARRAWPASFTFVEGDLDALLASDGAGFDRIASVNVIWTLPDPAGTLGRMTRALRPGGRMVHATPRRSFKPYVILWRHLRRKRGWRLVRALATLPLLGVAGLLNLALVIHSGFAARAPGAAQRWDGVVDLVRESGAVPHAVASCYAEQDVLVVATRDETVPTQTAPQTR